MQNKLDYHSQKDEIAKISIPHTIGSLLVFIFVPCIMLFLLRYGFIVLRDSDAPRFITTISAIIWGVGGVGVLYAVTNWALSFLPLKIRDKVEPFVFVGPAVIIITWFLLLPALRSFYLSFFSKWANDFSGIENYIYVFTNRTMIQAFWNNLLWLVFGTGITVVLGLTIALLADRSSLEKTLKSFIFLPMAISMIGAAIIWKFVYTISPDSSQQIGLLNAIVVACGGDTVNWLIMRPWNTFFLIIVFVWMQTGFAMVILSAAIKAVPDQLLAAARIDGANEMTIIFKIIIPYIKRSLITVSTTVLIATLKTFDIVFTMTQGLDGTEVLASQQYKQMFKFFHYGRGSAIAIIIFLAVVPAIVYNLKHSTIWKEK
ncbi:MAG: carbohydrate ABC transporter permease [Spirochaetia bacterium]